MKGLEFDDVLVVPKSSRVCSRDSVDISVKLPKGQKLNFPLIASPMVGVVDGAFAKLLSDLGGLAIIHRFYYSREDKIVDIENNLSEKDMFGIAVKVGEENIEELLYLNPTILLVDTANGYTDTLAKYCEKLADMILKHNFSCNLMAGNVVTGDGFKKLYDAGCNIIRVGIGGGSVCSTRNVTGIGVPNITAIQLCLKEKLKADNRVLIAIDGGIRSSGDLVKSFVAGADLGMSGKLFSQCYEAPNKGALYGMSSKVNMKNSGIEIKSVEGFDIPVEKQYSLNTFVNEFGYGIKSAGTYIGSNSIAYFYLEGKFIEVSDAAIKKNIYR